MSSRLQRLLYEPDTEEWKRYQRDNLRVSANIYGGMALLFLVVLGYLVVFYFRINSRIPKGIPDDFLVLSLSETYPLAQELLSEDGQQMLFQNGVVWIYPAWRHYHNSAALLVFSPAGQAQNVRLDVTTEPQRYKFEFFLTHPVYGKTPQYKYIAQLKDDEMPEIVDSEEVFWILQESWGNQVLLENKHIGWPGALLVNNLPPEDGETRLEWQLCYQVGIFAPGESICSEPIISFGTQLASP